MGAERHTEEAQQGEKADLASTAPTCTEILATYTGPKPDLDVTSSTTGSSGPLVDPEWGTQLTDPPSQVHPYTSMSREEGLTAREEAASTPSRDVCRQHGVKAAASPLRSWVRLAAQDQGFTAEFTFNNFNCSCDLLCYQAVIFRPPDDLTGVVTTVRDFKVLN